MLKFQERNRVERELRESLEKAKEHIKSLETRLSADKQEMHRLRSLSKRLEKERNEIIQEHNRLKQENDALWDKCKKTEKKLLSPTVSDLKIKYDTKLSNEALQKQCRILEMEREHYALLLDAALSRLQTYESGIANLFRSGMGGRVRKRSSGMTVVAEPDDPTKICIVDRKHLDGVSRFSDIEEERSDMNSVVGESGSVYGESDCHSRHSRSRPGSLSEDFSETDSLHYSARFDGAESLASQLRGSSSAEDSTHSDRSPPTPRSRSRVSLDSSMAPTLLKKSASSPGTKPKKNLTRSSSEHAEREKVQVAPVSPTLSRTSQSEDKNSNAASNFGVLRQRRGGVVNLPPASLLVEHSKTKKPTWGRDILDKFKKKSSNPEKITDKSNQSNAFWQRNKSRSVKVRGEKGKEKPASSPTT